jgi:ATP-dependent helicase/nuclease subunit B
LKAGQPPAPSPQPRERAQRASNNWTVATRSLLRSRSTSKLLDRAATFLSKHSGQSEILILAPTRAAAHELAITAFQNGCQGIHAFTLIQLAAHLAVQPMGRRALAPISRLGIEAIATRIVNAAHRSKKLRYFSPVAQTPGFPRALAHTIAELRLQNVPTRELPSIGPPGQDLAHLIELYEQELEQRSLADLPVLLAIAAEEAASNANRFTGLPILILDLTVESESHEKFLAALIEKSPDVVATAITGDEQSIAAVLKVAPEDLDAEPTITTLDRVRAWLFSPEQPPAAPPDPELLFSAPGESLECVEIARRIRALAAQGTPFDRMAILLRNVEQYQPLIEEALRRAAIPGYFSRGAARPDPAGRAFLALLACASDGCSASRFAEYLSLGQLPPVDQNGAPIKPISQWVPPDDEILANFSSAPPLPETTAPPNPMDETTLAVPIGWEKLLVDAAVIGGHPRWARRLRGLRAELQTQLRSLDKEDQSHRPHIERRIQQLTRLDHFALPLIDILGSLPKAAQWGEWLDRLSDLAQMALRYPESVLAVLSELRPMGEVGPATLEEVYDVLSEKMGSLRSDPPRRRYGHVFVGSIDEARGRAFDAVFLPGVAEGLFPRRALEDPLLLDEHRIKLQQTSYTLDISASPWGKSPTCLLETQNHRIARERMLLRSAAAAANQHLIVSYPRMDVTEARPRVPSFYALEILRAAEGRLPSLREFKERAASSAHTRLDWPAPSDPAIAIDDAEYDLASLQVALKLPSDVSKGSARYLMEVNESLARSLRNRGRRWRNRWTFADGLVDPDAPTLEVLKAHRFSQRSYSPSSLQHFAACPYRFLLQGIFQFQPRESPVPLEQMDPLTRGALFHEVQFQLFRKLKDTALLPISTATLTQTLDLTDQVLDRVAAEFEDDLAPAIQRVWKSEIEYVRTDLRGWIQQVAASPPDWLPLHFEFAFGLAASPHRDPHSTTEEATILNGTRLRGAIDLIEKHATRDILRVTDHKTGKAPQNRPQYVGGGAILQPLLYALAAEQLLGRPVESGSLFFCTQRGDFSTVSIPLDTQSRQRVARVLETIEHSVETGFLPAAPQAGACVICDYRPVCGPYEEQRSKRKQQDRLEPLITIRNLP